MMGKDEPVMLKTFKDSGWHVHWHGDERGGNYFSFMAGKRVPQQGDDAYLDDDWRLVLGAIERIRTYQGDNRFASICRCFTPTRPMPWRSRVLAP